MQSHLVLSKSSFFCVLIYCRRCYCHCQRGQHRRFLSSACTWADKRINQQSKVSNRNDNFLNCHSNTIKHNRRKSSAWKYLLAKACSMESIFWQMFKQVFVCHCRMETVCGSVVKLIELEKRMNLLKVCLFDPTHVCCWHTETVFISSSLLTVTETTQTQLLIMKEQRSSPWELKTVALCDLHWIFMCIYSTCLNCENIMGGVTNMFFVHAAFTTWQIGWAASTHITGTTSDERWEVFLSCPTTALPFSQALSHLKATMFMIWIDV